MVRNLALFGATGSIGQNTLKILEMYRHQFRLVAFSFHRNLEQARAIARKFRPRWIVSTGTQEIREIEGIPVLHGKEGLEEIASRPDVDIVVVATAGTIGVFPTLVALEQGKRVALANKETLVAFGPVVKPKMSLGELIPVDSEHSALFQLLQGRREEVAEVYLTASGGPFRETPLEVLRTVTPAQALRHPTWRMGKKITIDSATLMNKGLEVIEAHFLFDLSPDQIRVVIHPQSIVHALVYLKDSSALAHLGYPDMRIPIQYALTYPDRWPTEIRPLNLPELGRLTFEAPDLEKFQLLALAYRALEEGDSAPCVLNAANEEAVYAFLEEKIGFLEIPEVVESVLEARQREGIMGNGLEALWAADRWAREKAQEIIQRLAA